MLQLETNELLSLQDVLPKLQFIQRVQIVRLREGSSVSFRLSLSIGRWIKSGLLFIYMIFILLFSYSW
jgi:hypothetical protein